jgi:hypothetical protein
MTTKSPWKTWHKVFLSIVAAIILLFLLVINKADNAYQASLTPQQKDSIRKVKEAANQAERMEEEKKDRDKVIKKAFNEWDGSHINLVKLVKDNMNDPGSFEHVETKYWDNGDYLVLEMKYRGKNAFGGIVTQSIRAKSDLQGTILKILE